MTRPDAPIEELDLSVRAYNILKRNGLMTVRAVLEKSEEELFSLRNFGRQCYDELVQKIEDYQHGGGDGGFLSGAGTPALPFGPPGIWSASIALAEPNETDEAF